MNLSFLQKLGTSRLHAPKVILITGSALVCFMVILLAAPQIGGAEEPVAKGEVEVQEGGGVTETQADQEAQEGQATQEGQVVQEDQGDKEPQEAPIDPCRKPSTELKVALGLDRHNSGDYQAAAALFEEVLGACPEHPVALHAMGLARLALDDMDGAEDHLRSAIAAYGEDAPPVLFRHLAKVLLVREDYFWAMRELAEASEKDPRDMGTAYLLGVTLLRMDERDEAEQVLDRVVAGPDPQWSARARLLVGSARLLGGDMDRASQSLQAVQIDALGADDRALVQAYQAAVRSAQGRTARGLDGRISMALHHDSNVSLAYRGADQALLDNAASSALVLSGSGRWVPVTFGGVSLVAGLEGYRSFHQNTEVQAFNYTAVGVHAGPSFAGTLLGLEQTFDLAYRFHLGCLDGGPQTPVDTFHVFSESHGLGADWSVQMSANWQTSLRYAADFTTFVDLRRDNLAHRINLGTTGYLLARRLVVLADVGILTEDAHGIGYDRNGLSGALSLSYLGPWRVTSTGFVSARFLQHPNSAGYGDWEALREDDMISFGLSLSRPVGDSLRMSLAARRIDNASTVNRFDYRRDVVSLQLGGQI